MVTTAARRVIALDGPSGSGKTVLTAELAAFLRARGTAVTVIAMDDLYPGWHGLEAGVTRVVEGVLIPLSEALRALSGLPRLPRSA